MIRQLLNKNRLVSEDGFRFRGSSPSRMENLTDAVFGFSTTLLVITLQVPKTYAELQVSMHGFLGFVCSTTLILLLWNEHAKYFLRYGLDNGYTRFLNFIFLFLLLFYVYPLKYLFEVLGSFARIKLNVALGNTSDSLVLKLEELKGMLLGPDEWYHLMITYGLGGAAIYFIFFLWYRHAWNMRFELELHPGELFETKVLMYVQLLMMSVPLLSVILVVSLGGEYAWLGGMVYVLYAVTIPTYYVIAERLRRKKFGIS